MYIIGLTRIRTDKKLMASNVERQRQKLQDHIGSKKSFTHQDKQHPSSSISPSEHPAAVSFNNSIFHSRSSASLAITNTNNANAKININRSVVRQDPDLFPQSHV